MWPFRRKKIQQEQRFHPKCSYCGSTNTGLILYHGADHPDYIRVWRGQRYLTCRCFDCGLDFYAGEPKEGVTERLILEAENRIVDDEETLCAAEEELRRQIEEDDDRRYR